MTLNIFPSWYDTIMDYMICVGWWIHLLHNSFSTCERVCIGRGLRNDIKKVHVNGRIKEHVNLLIFIKWKSHFFEEQACLKTTCVVIILRYWCNIRICGGREKYCTAYTSIFLYQFLLFASLLSRNIYDIFSV